MSEDKEPIFLSTGRILPWRTEPEKPLLRGPLYAIETMGYNSSTKLIEDLGFQVLDETIGPYHIIASTAKYLADIIPFEGLGSEKETEPERKILFSGGLIVYQQGNIVGTELEGDTFVRQKRIWVATEPSEEYQGEQGLKKLVLNNPPDIAHLEAVLKGYDVQEEDRREAEYQENERRYRQSQPLPAGRSGPC